MTIQENSLALSSRSRELEAAVEAWIKSIPPCVELNILHTITQRDRANLPDLQAMRDAIQRIADCLRDIGAGHHSDWLIQITNTKELAAAARDIEQGGYDPKALENLVAELQSQQEN